MRHTRTSRLAVLAFSLAALPSIAVAQQARQMTRSTTATTLGDSTIIVTSDTLTSKTTFITKAASIPQLRKAFDQGVHDSVASNGFRLANGKRFTFGTTDTIFGSPIWNTAQSFTYLDITVQDTATAHAVLVRPMTASTGSQIILADTTRAGQPLGRISWRDNTDVLKWDLATKVNLSNGAFEFNYAGTRQADLDTTGKFTANKVVSGRDSITSGTALIFAGNDTIKGRPVVVANTAVVFAGSDTLVSTGPLIVAGSSTSQFGVVNSYTNGTTTNIRNNATQGNALNLFSDAHGGNQVLAVNDTDPAVSTNDEVTFYRSNNSGVLTAVGHITTTQAGVTGYVTSSDARLKNDLGVATTTSVLPRTVIHDFTWKAGGARDRGVFAQEAYKVKPSAVWVGTDSLVNGLPVRPWQIDYSKYVPDLIVGWQQQERLIESQARTIAGLEDRLATMERRLDALDQLLSPGLHFSPASVQTSTKP